MSTISVLLFSKVRQSFWSRFTPEILASQRVHVCIVWTRSGSRSHETRDEVMQPHDLTPEPEPEKHITLFHVIKYHDLKLKLIKLSISCSSART